VCKICWVESTGAMKETAKEGFSFSVVPHTPIIIGHFMVSLCFFALLFPLHLPLACQSHVLVISIPSSIVFYELSVHIYQTIFFYIQEDHTFGGVNMLNTNSCRTFFLLQECMAHHLANSSYCLWMMWTCPWRRSMGLSLPSSFSGNYMITGRGITRMLPLSNWLTCR